MQGTKLTFRKSMTQAAINAQSQRGQGGVTPLSLLPSPPLAVEVLSSLPGTGEVTDLHETSGSSLTFVTN